MPENVLPLINKHSVASFELPKCVAHEGTSGDGDVSEGLEKDSDEGQCIISHRKRELKIRFLRTIRGGRSLSIFLSQAAVYYGCF
jgi:hypothetical protein